MRRRFCLSLTLVIIVFAPGVTRGDGGFLYSFDEAITNLAQTRQEALLAIYTNPDDGLPRVTYALRTRYAGEVDEFAWVIPTPNTPMDVVAHDDGALFDSLDSLTRPGFLIINSGQSLGCGCSAGVGGIVGGDVDVEASGAAGIFDWAALRSSGADALLTWLNSNGFAVPVAAEDVLARYVDQERHFLALRVRESGLAAAGSNGTMEIPPIQFTCQTAERFYPMAISRISAAENTEVVVYVHAEHRAEAANIANVVIDPAELRFVPDNTSLTNYESLFTQRIADHGGQALVTESVHPYTFSIFDWLDPPAGITDFTVTKYLTRLRTVIARADMTIDFEFQDAADDSEVSNFFQIDARPVDDAQAALIVQPLGALLLLGLAHRAFQRCARHRRPGVSW